MSSYCPYSIFSIFLDFFILTIYYCKNPYIKTDIVHIQLADHSSLVLIVTAIFWNSGINRKLFFFFVVKNCIYTELKGKLTLKGLSDIIYYFRCGEYKVGMNQQTKWLGKCSNPLMGLVKTTSSVK